MLYVKGFKFTLFCLLFGLTSQTAMAVDYVINDKVAKSPPARFFGTGKTQKLACDAAKSDAVRKAPKQTYARHCYCDSNKR